MDHKDFIKSLKDAQAHSGELSVLPEPYPPLSEHKAFEEKVREDPTLEIIGEFEMSPWIQKIWLEWTNIMAELHMIAAEGEMCSLYMQERATESVEYYNTLKEWMIAQLNDTPETAEKVKGRIPLYRIGANWRMLVVVRK